MDNYKDAVTRSTVLNQIDTMHHVSTLNRNNIKTERAQFIVPLQYNKDNKFMFL